MGTRCFSSERPCSYISPSVESLVSEVMPDVAAQYPRAADMTFHALDALFNCITPKSKTVVGLQASLNAAAALEALGFNLDTSVAYLEEKLVLGLQKITGTEDVADKYIWILTRDFSSDPCPALESPSPMPSCSLSLFAVKRARPFSATSPTGRKMSTAIVRSSSCNRVVVARRVSSLKHSMTIWVFC